MDPKTGQVPVRKERPVAINRETALRYAEEQLAAKHRKLQRLTQSVEGMLRSIEALQAEIAELTAVPE